MVGYIAASQTPAGQSRCIRLYNSGPGQHFYTTSEPETKYANSFGMTDEGVIGYVWQ